MVYEIVCKYTKSSPNTHFDNALHRASRSCRRADTRLRKVLKNLRKICTFERKTGTLHFFMILAQFDKTIKGFACLLWHFKPTPLHKIFRQTFGLRKNLMFRRSGIAVSLQTS